MTGYEPLACAQRSLDERPDGPLRRLFDRLDRVRRNGNGWVARCPAHEDRNPSLGIAVGEDGRVLLTCYAGCGYRDIVAAIGLEERDLFERNGDREAGSHTGRANEPTAVHVYHDETGQPLFEVRRFAREQSKCLPFLPGATTPGIGDTRRVIYRLPEVLTAIRDGETVYVCEGEKDADAMESAGVTATTNPFGADSWGPEHTETLRGANVAVVQDRDAAGRERGQKLLRELGAAAASVRLAEPCVGKDAHDHLKAGRTVDELTPVDAENAFRGPSERATRKESASSAALPFAPLAQSLSGTSDTVEWIWRGYIARATKVLLASRPKAGKSTLLFGLLAAIERRTLFLGLETNSTGVLLLSEEPASTIRQKAVRFGLDLSFRDSRTLRPRKATAAAGVHLLRRQQALGRTWDEVIDQAVAYAVEYGLDVLVIDTLDKWAGIRGDDENKTGALLAVMEPLEHAVAAGVAVIVITHQRKSGGEFGEAVRGGNALVGAVDVVLELDRPPSSVTDSPASRVLRAIGRFEETPEEVVVELDGHGYRVLGDLDAVRETHARDEVLAAIATFDCPVTPKQLSEALGVPESTARGRLNATYKHGHLRRLGEGKKGNPYMFELNTDPGVTSQDELAARVRQVKL